MSRATPCQPDIELSSEGMRVIGTTTSVSTVNVSPGYFPKIWSVERERAVMPFTLNVSESGRTLYQYAAILLFVAGEKGYSLAERMRGRTKK